ncbi:peptidoglycan-binding protein [Streptomyces sp. C1-2]|uniref:peptidoglycan-binding protein n=1 Tax=Streptomyces sp. C1-2 TaxID=2720022 RepID=UPI0014327100|nr:peptidoglycan-binding protein [Streptomyces sp. C1-2]NJP72778.1 helix-turn-helix domain-containing protein [Streptomyces sp. C1-2]
MSRWTELPESLDQRVRQLVIQLRRLKDRSGLSLVSLAVRTSYSRSSWERYLNGKALPPRKAVEELATVARGDPTRLLVLHEVAEEAWRQQTAPSSPPAGADSDAVREARDGTATEPSGTTTDAVVPAETSEATEPTSKPSVNPPAKSPGVRVPVALAAVVAAALVGMGAGMLITGPWDHDDGGRDGVRTAAVGGPLPSATTSTSAAGTATGGLGRYVFEPGKTYPCEVREADAVGGELSAGYSTTRTAVLAGPGWDVVEAQCLLAHRGLRPGPVDGVYGQQTIAAVMRLQKKTGLPQDGVVGPHTWQALRG